MNLNNKLHVLINKKRPISEITKSNSSFKTNRFKMSRISAKIYERETGIKVNKDKIISNDEKKSKICKITNDDRILASTNNKSYKKYDISRYK